MLSKLMSLKWKSIDYSPHPVKPSRINFTGVGERRCCILPVHVKGNIKHHDDTSYRITVIIVLCDVS